MNWMLCAVGALALTGCSPALNWRAVEIDGVGMVVMLPCKPDRASRPIELAGLSVDLHMQGCDADGLSFAVSHVAWPEPARAPDALAHWRAATLARMAAVQPTPALSPLAIQGTLPIEGAGRLNVAGQRPEGGPVVADAMWLARAQGEQLHLVHAVVYGAKPRPEVADTFMTSLVVR